MRKIFKNRLLKLAEHLERGKLIHKKFDFSVLNENVTSVEEWEVYREFYRKSYKERQLLPTPETPKVELRPYACGTLGCALGEMPGVAKKAWNFSRDNEPHLKGSRKDAFESAQVWFGVGSKAVDHLFVPGEQVPEDFGGEYLNGEATAKQVAANIRAFIKRKEKDDAKRK